MHAKLLPRVLVRKVKGITGSDYVRDPSQRRRLAQTVRSVKRLIQLRKHA